MSEYPKTIGPIRVLAKDEFDHVMSLPILERQDLFIAGYYDYLGNYLILVRGDHTTVMVPMSIFPPSSKGIIPDPECLEFIDHGNTVKMGEYETASDAILYDLAPKYLEELDEAPGDGTPLSN